MTSEASIRKQLSEVLNKDPNNYSKILELSNELASFDLGNARFTVDAGVIDRLGRELVGRKETAVSELIKNSYDADASTVDLYFENSDELGGTLRIVDNGLGMTRNELIRGFMRISSTDKVHNPKSPQYTRTRAGKKGIGRFAVQRLGEHLSIITRKRNSKHGLRINVDWTKYKADHDLFSVAHKIEDFQDAPVGTQLIIQNLRDKWVSKDIERIYRYVTALIQPYPLSKERIADEKQRLELSIDPGFKANLYKSENGLNHLIANEETEIFAYAMAMIEADVDMLGVSRYKVESKKLGILPKWRHLGATRENAKEPYKFLKNVSLKAHYFVSTGDSIPPQQKSKINDLAQHSGGIRLYRNGFRVLPYAEPFNDWLKLDESVRKRTILPVHGNTNFFGFVEVTDPQDQIFKETSSREGLLENDAFIELQDFAYRAIIAGVTQVSHQREVKITTNQKGWTKKFERATDRLKYVQEEIKKVAEETKEDIKVSNQRELSKEDVFIRLNERSASITTIEKSLHKLIEEQEAEDENQLKEKNLLRVLASLGLSLGMFTHEIRQYLASIAASFKILQTRYIDDRDYQDRIKRLQENIQLLRTYTSYFDRTISENVSRELVPQDIRDVILKFVDVISDEGKNKAIQIEYDIQETELYSVPMHQSEWATIFFNFFTNSTKAIKRAGKKGRILITAKEEGDLISLTFEDNGDGIPKENWRKVFEPFFTTSTPVGHFAEEQDEVLGTGLGLKIVRDTIVAYNGNIEVVTPRNGLNTAIRIQIPKKES